MVKARKNLKFSTNSDPLKSKTKCIIFYKKSKQRVPIKPVQLSGKPLPWVHQIKHIGSMLQGDNSMKVDLSQKRGTFIGRMNSLLQEFHYVDPDVLIKIINIFNTSYYGSSLWDIFSSLQVVECLYEASTKCGQMYTPLLD